MLFVDNSYTIHSDKTKQQITTIINWNKWETVFSNAKKILFFLISFHWSLNTLFWMFALLVDGLRAGLSFQNKLSVLVQLQFGYDYLWGVNADGHGGTIGLFALNTLNVNDIFASVTLQHFARLLTFVVTSGYLFVIRD